MGIFGFGKDKGLSEKQKSDLIAKAWTFWKTGEMQAPIAQFMTVLVNLGACGHALFLSNLEENAQLAEIFEIGFPLFDQRMKDNFQRAKALFDATPKDQRTEDLLDEFDEFFYSNDHLNEEIIVSFTK